MLTAWSAYKHFFKCQRYKFATTFDHFVNECGSKTCGEQVIAKYPHLFAEQRKAK